MKKAFSILLVVLVALCSFYIYALLSPSINNKTTTSRSSSEVISNNPTVESLERDSQQLFAKSESSKKRAEQLIEMARSIDDE